MADLVAGDVTVTVEERYARGGTKRKRHRVKIAFGNGTLTYPSGGVPMPTYPSFGLTARLDFLNMFDGDDGQGVYWKYDKENAKMRAYIPAIVVGAAGALTVDDFPLDTTAEPLATTVSLSLTNKTGAGTKYLGRQKELIAASHAPAATVLYAEAVGW